MRIKYGNNKKIILALMKLIINALLLIYVFVYTIVIKINIF